MRGPYQESHRIPHALTELPPNPNGLKWQVTLTPHEQAPVVCEGGRTMTEALDIAERTIQAKFPGGTL